MKELRTKSFINTQVMVRISVLKCIDRIELIGGQSKAYWLSCNYLRWFNWYYKNNDICLCFIHLSS